MHDCAENFNWAGISPTIFGAVFEGTLNSEIRRKSGMHYTSIENIHKVIDPLFLDELREELNEIEDETSKAKRNQKLDAYQNKLASLHFLDPACGSGNFLTETYLSLRKLEKENNDNDNEKVVVDVKNEEKKEDDDNLENKDKMENDLNANNEGIKDDNSQHNKEKGKNLDDINDLISKINHLNI